MADPLTWNRKAPIGCFDYLYKFQILYFVVLTATDRQWVASAGKHPLLCLMLVYQSSKQVDITSVLNFQLRPSIVSLWEVLT